MILEAHKVKISGDPEGAEQDGPLQEPQGDDAEDGSREEGGQGIAVKTNDLGNVMDTSGSSSLRWLVNTRKVK